jgi:hypothetical protein
MTCAAVSSMAETVMKMMVAIATIALLFMIASVMKGCDACPATSARPCRTFCPRSVMGRTSYDVWSSESYLYRRELFLKSRNLEEFFIKVAGGGMGHDNLANTAAVTF